MFSKLVSMAKNVAKQGESFVNRTIGKTLFTRMVYAGFLIASADDDFDSDEKKALVKLINRDLPDFKMEDIAATIKVCEDKISFDKQMGTQEILDEISVSASDPEDAKAIMKVCAFIGKADGDYDKDEKLMARSICSSLKLKQSEYGL